MSGAGKHVDRRMRWSKISSSQRVDARSIEIEASTQRFHVVVALPPLQHVNDSKSHWSYVEPTDSVFVY